MASALRSVIIEVLSESHSDNWMDQETQESGRLSQWDISSVVAELSNMEREGLLTFSFPIGSKLT